MQREHFTGRVHPGVMRWMERQAVNLGFKSVATVIEWMAKALAPEQFSDLTPGKYERENQKEEGKHEQ